MLHGVMQMNVNRLTNYSDVSDFTLPDQSTKSNFWKVSDFKEEEKSPKTSCAVQSAPDLQAKKGKIYFAYIPVTLIC